MRITFLFLATAAAAVFFVLNNIFLLIFSDPLTQDRPETNFSIGTINDHVFQKKYANSGDPTSAAICVIQKGHRRFNYLDDFVDYHLFIGFDHIYVYDNSDDFELNGWISSRRCSQKLSVSHLPGPGMQFTAYSECVKYIKARGSSSWVAFIDPDEYVVLKKHSSIVDLLATVPDNAGGLALNWYMFTWNNQYKYEPFPLPKRFTQREANVNEHVKVIARVSLIQDSFNNPHFVHYNEEGICSVDTEGREICGDTPFNQNGPTDVAVIHHYWAKSVEEFMYRKERGRPVLANDGSPAKNLPLVEEGTESTIVKHFQQLDINRGKNFVIDDSVWTILEKAKKNYRTNCPY